MSWWEWILASIGVYMAMGAVTTSIAPHVVSRTVKDSIEESITRNEAAAMFWLWPILFIAGIIWVPGWVLPIAVARLTGPAKWDIEGRGRIDK